MLCATRPCQHEHYSTDISNKVCLNQKDRSEILFEATPFALHQFVLPKVYSSEWLLISVLQLASVSECYFLFASFQFSVYLTILHRFTHKDTYNSTAIFLITRRRERALRTTFRVLSLIIIIQIYIVHVCTKHHVSTYIMSCMDVESICPCIYWSVCNI